MSRPRPWLEGLIGFAATSEDKWVLDREKLKWNSDTFYTVCIYVRHTYIHTYIHTHIHNTYIHKWLLVTSHVGEVQSQPPSLSFLQSWGALKKWGCSQAEWIKSPQRKRVERITPAMGWRRLNESRSETYWRWGSSNVEGQGQGHSLLEPAICPGQVRVLGKDLPVSLGTYFPLKGHCTTKRDVIGRGEQSHSRKQNESHRQPLKQALCPTG